jgi:hypothetical protein
VKIIVEKQMECRLAGETEVLGENLPQRHFFPSVHLVLIIFKAFAVSEILCLKCLFFPQAVFEIFFATVNIG